MSNDWLRRYRAGESERVWDEMTALGAAIFADAYRTDATAVALETMTRVRGNLERILRRLDREGYQFAAASPLTPPSPQLRERIAAIERDHGPMPLCFEAFYSIVGTVDFRQNTAQLVQCGACQVGSGIGPGVTARA